jgi:hypothetical protein
VSGGLRKQAFVRLRLTHVLCFANDQIILP